MSGFFSGRPRNLIGRSAQLKLNSVLVAGFEFKLFTPEQKEQSEGRWRPDSGQ
jgi:hypothetical protein